MSGRRGAAKQILWKTGGTKQKHHSCRKPPGSTAFTTPARPKSSRSESGAMHILKQPNAGKTYATFTICHKPGRSAGRCLRSPKGVRGKNNS